MKTTSSLLKLLLTGFIICVFSCTLLKAQFPAFPPANVTNTQDRDQMMWQLGITAPSLPSKLTDPNRPYYLNARPSDASNPEGNWTDDRGNTITRSGWGLWNNYADKSSGFFPGSDSTKLGEYTPINLLKMRDSAYYITTPEEWWNLRRPEIFKDIQQHLYGFIPHDSILPSVSWSVTTTTGGNGASAYIQKVITGTIDISRYPAVRNRPQISATLRVPANAAGPVPVMVVFWGSIDTYWNYAYPQGWGACSFDATALQPDNGAGLTSYLIGLVNKGNWRTPEQWGSLVAWAWGVSKLIDYFETDPHVDATKIGVTGHSRYGKATIVTMAYDQRVFIAFPSDAGSLGTKMNRRHWGQDLENSTWDQEYHWMAGNFFKWVGEKIPGQYLPRKIEDCPVDAHSLLALCAPRPVFINGGNQSSWCDPYGMFLTTVAATPVYELLGHKGMIMKDEKPVIDKGYIEGDIGYRYHTGGHTDAPDWPAFWQFAAKYVKMSTLSYSPGSIILNDTANSTAKITINSDTTWTISGSPSWVTLNKTSGIYNDTIIITAEANTADTARQDTLTIIAPGLKPMIILVNQNTSAPGFITVTADTLYVGDTASVHTVDVQSNAVWTVTNTGTWITPEPSSNVNNNSVALSVSPNTQASIRTQNVIFYVAPGIADTLVVRQSAAPATLMLFSSSFTPNPTSVNTAATANNSSTLWAMTNSTLSLSSSEAWMIPSSEASPYFQGWYTIRITVTANPNLTERQAILTVSVPTLNPVNITVIQAAASAELSVTPSSINLYASANSTGTISVTSNTSWNASSDQAWLTVNPASGSGNATVTVTAEENTGATRTANITISATGTAAKTVMVTQYGETGMNENPLPQKMVISQQGNLLNIMFNKIIEKGNVRLIDLSGTLIILYQIDNSNFLSLPIATIKKGMYIVSIETENETFNQKITLQ